MTIQLHSRLDIQAHELNGIAHIRWLPRRQAEGIGIAAFDEA